MLRFVKSPELKLTTSILFIAISSLFFAQEIDSLRTPFFSLGRTDIDLGANAGVQSNFLDKRGRMNHFMEVSSSFMFKNPPLTFQGRLSDEKYISGKPTYFRLSYDALAKYRMRKAELEHEIGGLNTDIGGTVSYTHLDVYKRQVLGSHNA